MKSHYETGVVLVIILILLTIISLLSIYKIEQCVVVAKLSNQSKVKYFEDMHHERTLVELEHKLLSSLEDNIPYKKMFVPNHLGFACQEGVEFYTLTAGAFQTQVSVQRQHSSRDKLHTSFSEVLKKYPKPIHSVSMKRSRSQAFSHLPGYLEFIYQYPPNRLSIFGLANNGSEKGVVFGWDHIDQRELQYELPFFINSGKSVIFDAYIGDKWKKVLVIYVSGESKNLILAFDITDNARSFLPFLTFDALSNYSTMPELICIDNYGFGIVWGDLKSNTSYLNFIFFNNPLSHHVLEMGHKQIIGLSIIDRWQQGRVSRIYIAEANALTALDVQQIYNAKKIWTKEIPQGKVLSAPIAFINHNVPGVLLYFMMDGGQGLYKITDNFVEERDIPLINIVQGNFETLKSCFGGLIIIPHEMNSSVLLMNLFSEQIKKLDVSSQYNNDNICELFQEKGFVSWRKAS